MFISAVQEREPAVCSISPPSEACLHPAPYVITAHQAGLLLRHRGFPLAACSPAVVCVCPCYPLNSSFSPCPASPSESLFLPRKQVHLCHFSSFHAVRSRLGMSNSATTWLWPARLLCPWNFPARNTGADCHFQLQGIFC